MKRKSLVVLLTLTLVLSLIGFVQADTFVLSGNVLNVGVSNSGGLIDDLFTAGIQYKPAWSGNDYLRPGTPFEFYSIGVGGSTWQAAGYTSGNPFNLISSNTSGGSTLSGTTKAKDGPFTLDGANLFYFQNIYFDKTSNRINFSVDILNAGDSPAKNVVYARGLDPDQDVYVGGGFATKNSIPPVSGAGKVGAVGYLTGLYINIGDYTGTGVPTVDAGWDQNPYNLLIPHNAGNGDYTINMAWNIGDLDAHTSKEIDFYYQVGTVPEPATLFLLGSGLLGMGAYVRRRFKK